MIAVQMTEGTNICDYELHESDNELGKEKAIPKFKDAVAALRTLQSFKFSYEKKILKLENKSESRETNFLDKFLGNIFLYICTNSFLIIVIY